MSRIRVYETVGQQGYQKRESKCTLRVAYRLAERGATPAGQLCDDTIPHE